MWCSTACLEQELEGPMNAGSFVHGQRVQLGGVFPSRVSLPQGSGVERALHREMFLTM